MPAKVFAGTFGVWSKLGDGVEIMVVHDRLCRSCIDHAPDQIDRLQLLGPAVDEVADKKGLPLRMTPDAPVYLYSILSGYRITRSLPMGITCRRCAARNMRRQRHPYIRAER